MRADWYETRTPRRQTAFLPPVTTIWILQGSQCSPHFFLPKLNSIASVGWFKMQIRYSTNAPEDHNIILNPGFKICRLKEPTVLEGNSITLEHSPKHHLGTQPFLDSFGTQNDYILSSHSRHTKHQIYWQAQQFGSLARSSDPSTKKKAPIPDFVLTSSAVIPIATLWPWNSLCSTTDPFRAYLDGRGKSIPAIYRNNHLEFIGGNSYLHHLFNFFSKVRT